MLGRLVVAGVVVLAARAVVAVADAWAADAEYRAYAALFSLGRV